MEHKALEHLYRVFDKKIKELEEFTGEGGCRDYPHYRELCGLIRGLRTAQSEINDLVQRYKDFDDD